MVRVGGVAYRVDVGPDRLLLGLQLHEPKSSRQSLHPDQPRQRVVGHYVSYEATSQLLPSTRGGQPVLNQLTVYFGLRNNLSNCRLLKCISSGKR